jgi:hypothetical protein
VSSSASPSTMKGIGPNFLEGINLNIKVYSIFSILPPVSSSYLTPKLVLNWFII